MIFEYLGNKEIKFFVKFNLANRSIAVSFGSFNLNDIISTYRLLPIYLIDIKISPILSRFSLIPSTML